ncbi:MAG: HPr family phosphocarrier protein [Clostridia bacterium]|nr:HPr family phosphocarrier protein [Clostridia bacterium]
MIQEKVNLKTLLPMKRQTAAEIATLASRFECTFTLEAQNLILNAKSMLGLLSMALPTDGEVILTADGADEAQAVASMKDLLRRLMAQLD